jgi:murein L,D-transpeptidase YafK
VCECVFFGAQISDNLIAKVVISYKKISQIQPYKLTRYDNTKQNNLSIFLANYWKLSLKSGDLKFFVSPSVMNLGQMFYEKSFCIC